MVYKFNGEYWYADNRSSLRRALTWLIWVGGWGRVGGGIDPLVKTSRGWRFRDLAPLSLFGHRFTYYSWGWEVRTPEGTLVYSRDRHGAGTPAIYISRDGTPDAAHIWISGTPRDVVEMAERARRQREARA